MNDQVTLSNRTGEITDEEIDTLVTVLIPKGRATPYEAALVARILRMKKDHLALYMQLESMSKQSMLIRGHKMQCELAISDASTYARTVEHVPCTCEWSVKEVSHAD